MTFLDDQGLDFDKARTFIANKWTYDVRSWQNGAEKTLNKEAMTLANSNLNKYTKLAFLLTLNTLLSLIS